MEQQTTAPQGETTPQPAATMPLGDVSNLDVYREGKAKGLTEIPNPAAKPAADPPVEDAPDPEVESDPDLRQAIDELEAPKDNETPAEKAARTRRHKEAARKGYATRLQNKAAKLTAENEALRRQIQTRSAPSEQPGGGDPAARPTGARPAARPEYDGSHPKDPEPTLDQFGDTNDPLVEFTRAHNEWTARKAERRIEYRQTQNAKRTEAQTRFVEDVKSFDAHANDLRKTDPGFDAKVADLELTRPMWGVITKAGQLGPHIALHLASHPDVHRRLLTLSPAEQLIEMGEIKATVTAVRASKSAPAASSVTAAPAPHQPVGAAASASARFDPSTTTNLDDYRRAKSAGLLKRS
jgi:hypothetical protein